jgi:hypothetical protein
MKPLYCACCDTPLMSAATAFVCPTCGAVYRQHGTRFAFAAERECKILYQDGASE